MSVDIDMVEPDRFTEAIDCSASIPKRRRDRKPCCATQFVDGAGKLH
jgi:hypothetical protein